MTRLARADHVVIIVENMSVPRDRRVWQEAMTLRTAGLDVSVVCPRGAGDEAAYERLNGIDIHRHPLEPSAGGAGGYLREYAQALIAEWRTVREIHGRRAVDIIQICNPPDVLSLVALWFKLRHGTTVVFDHHDLAPELYVAKYGRRGFFHRALLLAERLTFRIADVVISANRSYRRIALERGRVRPERIFVVRSAPDLDRFADTGSRRDHRGGREFLIGYAGVLGGQDGLDVLLRVARRLIDERYGEGLHVMIIGDGPHAAVLRRMSVEMGLAGQVEFTGWQNGPALVDRLASCDACVCPDPSTEFGDRSTMIKVMEYMALAKPVVMFDSLEGRRSAGGSALYARAGDEEDFARQVARLLDSPGLRLAMGRKGRQRIEHRLSWEHQVPRLLDAYECARRIRSERRGMAVPVPPSASRSKGSS